MKKDVLIGTAIGDIVGSRFEFSNNQYGKEFDLFNKQCRFTDDTVMTFAVAKALIETKDDFSDIEIQSIKNMVEVGRRYIACGYGGKFRNWIMSEEHEPYGSYGNGAAMRISPIGAISKDIEEAKKLSSIITNVSHNHPDSINGAQAVSIAIYMALKGESKEKIKEYIEANYFEINDLKSELMRPRIFRINCIETVKQSLSSFIDSTDYEDSIRNAISLGGDSDTIAAITGSISTAYYGIPDDIYNQALEYLDPYLINIHDEFNKKLTYKKH